MLFFSFPSSFRIVGIDFFIPFPFPIFGNGFFSFPSCSRIEGMVFFSIPFPFPNFGNGIIHSRSRSRTPKCHSRSPLMGFLDEANCACRCFSSQQERLPQGLETGEKKVRVRFMKVFQPLYVWTIISCLIYSLIRPKKFSRRAT